MIARYSSAKRSMLIAIGLFALLTAAYWMFFSGTNSPFLENRLFQGKSSDSLKLGSRPLESESRKVTRSRRDSHSDSSELEEFKARWLAMKPSAKSGLITEECRQLGRESAQRLLCSQETIELILFMESNGLANGLHVLDQEILNLLRSPRSDEARESLIKIDGNMAEPESSARYCVQWSYAAGQGCSEEELQEFCSAMKDKECVTSAILGRNLTLAETDPVGAIASTLKILEGGEVGGYAWMSMRDQVAKLPPDSDFAAIEMLFPVEDPSDKRPNSEIEIGRKTLFIQWAKANPADAANHVMEFPERFEPSLIRVIAETVAKTNPMVGFEWARSFPAGPYFDEAAESTIAHLRDSHPQKALELASLIGDAERRRRTIDFIHLSQQPGAHGR